MKIDLQTSSELVFCRSPLLSDLYADVCVDYMEYLADARSLLKACQMKCACWSAPYDGQNPAPPDPSSVERDRSLSNSASVTNGDIPNRTSQSLGPEDEHAPVKRSKSATEYEQKQRKPDLGPFLVTLFQKIERMPQNSFYVNLILTGVVSRLALYPQPLLRSILLNYNMVLKPGVRSLFQVGDCLTCLLWLKYFLLIFVGCVFSLTEERSLNVFFLKNCPSEVDFIHRVRSKRESGLISHSLLRRRPLGPSRILTPHKHFLKKALSFPFVRKEKGCITYSCWHLPVWDACSTSIYFWE